MNARRVEPQTFDAGVPLEAVTPQTLAGSPNPLPFGAAHAAEPGRPRTHTAGSHLDDEHQLGAPGDDVELQPPEPEVPGKNGKTSAFQVARHGVFSAPSERRAKVNAVRHV